MTILRADAVRRLARWLILVASFAFGHANAQTYNYGGGDVIANPEIVVVYWGKQRSGLQASLDQFYPRLTRSTYFDLLREYSTPRETIGKVAYVKSVSIKPSDGAIQVDTVETAREIDRQILNGTLPFPGENTLYVVHFGEFMDVVMGSNLFGMAVGGEPTMGFCAYHFSARAQVPTPFPGIAVFGPKMRIAVIPDPGRIGSICQGKMSVLAATTFNATHEIVETITNPDSVLVEMPPLVGANVQCNTVRLPVSSLSPVGTVPPAFNGLEPWSWTSSASQFCNPDEVSDTCTTPASYNTTGLPDGVYSVSPIFLNSRRACTVAANVPPPPAPRPPPNARCMAACQATLSQCLDVADTPRRVATCNLAAQRCKARC